MTKHNILTKLLNKDSDCGTTPKHGNSVHRKDIPNEYKWRIEDIYADKSQWEQACEALREMINQLNSLKGNLNSKDALLQALHLRDNLSIEIDKIYAYAHLQQDADSQDSEIQSLSGISESLLADYGNAVSFIDSELIEMFKTDSPALKDKEAFKDYDFYFEDLKRQAEHILSAPEEALLSRSLLMSRTGNSVFSSLVSADMKFADVADEDGKMHAVSEGSYLLNMGSNDRTLRKNTFRELMGGYHKYRNTLAATLTGACRSSYFNATARKFPDTRHAALSSENIPVDLYDTLIETVNANLEPLHEYMELKKEILGYETLHPYDIYVPMVKEGGESFANEFPEACNIVCEALAPLGKAYTDQLRKAMDSRWIDVYENSGKRSGAYSWGMYDVHPYVLLNYQPRYQSMSTIAHELGHSLHSWYSAKSQPYIKSEYTIFCAEVASTTNENLLLEYALSHADKKQKIYLLNQFLETVRTTVYRQVQFADFEKFIHDKITAGEALQADALDKYWIESNQKYYGDAFTVDEELAAEWSRIPHFYTPFYVYKYATGYAAATAFGKLILTGGKEAVEKYHGFLKAGGSKYSLDILKDAGVDLRSPEPVQLTLDKFADKLKELKELLNN